MKNEHDANRAMRPSQDRRKGVSEYTRWQARRQSARK